MQSCGLKFLELTVLQRVEFHIFPMIFAWALQQCSANVLPVILGLNIAPFPLLPSPSLLSPLLPFHLIEVGPLNTSRGSGAL